MLPALGKLVVKPISAINLSPDFAAVNPLPRCFAFRKFTVKFAPLAESMAIGTSPGLSAQLFAYTQQNTVLAPTQQLVTLTKQFMLSYTNTTVITVRIPEWLISPQFVSASAANVLAVGVTSSVPAVAAQTMLFTVIAKGEITCDVPQEF